MFRQPPGWASRRRVARNFLFYGMRQWPAPREKWEMTGQNFTACHLARALSQAQTHSLSPAVSPSILELVRFRGRFFRMIWSGVGSFTMMNFNIIKIKMTHSRSCSIIVCGREGGSDRRSRIIWLQEIVNPAALHIWQIWSTTRLVAHLTPLCWKHEEAKHRAKKKS